MKTGDVALLSATILSGIIAKSGLATADQHVTVAVRLARTVLAEVESTEPTPEAPIAAAASVETAAEAEPTKGDEPKPIELEVIERQPPQRSPTHQHRGSHRR